MTWWTQTVTVWTVGHTAPEELGAKGPVPWVAGNEQAGSLPLGLSTALPLL